MFNLRTLNWEKDIRIIVQVCPIISLYLNDNGVTCNRPVVARWTTSKYVGRSIMHRLHDVYQSHFIIPRCHFTNMLGDLFTVQSIPIKEPISLLKGLVKRHPGLVEPLQCSGLKYQLLLILICYYACKPCEYILCYHQPCTVQVIFRHHWWLQSQLLHPQWRNYLPRESGCHFTKV